MEPDGGRSESGEWDCGFLRYAGGVMQLIPGDGGKWPSQAIANLRLPSDEVTTRGVRYEL